MSTLTLASGGMIPVESSNVTAIGYDWFKATVSVAFRNRTLYEYYKVPASVFREFLDAGSKGGFVHHRLHCSYRYKRIV